MSAISAIERAVPLVLSALLLAGSSMAQAIPAKLMPPAEARHVGAYTAKGVQIYVCAPRDTANQWVFKAPEAQLLDANGKIFAKHYAGPSWEATDGSKIVGKVMAKMPAPTDGAIPWLLLSTQSSGNGVLAGARCFTRSGYNRDCPGS